MALGLTGRAEPIRPSGGRRRTVADGVRPNRLQRLFERPPKVACRTGAGAKLSSPFPARRRRAGNMGFTSFMLRGLEKVKGEFKLVSTAHNLRKIWLNLKANGKTLAEMRSVPGV